MDALALPPDSCLNWLGGDLALAALKALQEILICSQC